MKVKGIPWEEVKRKLLSKLERNAFKASVATLSRYAQACGAQLIVRAEPVSA